MKKNTFIVVLLVVLGFIVSGCQKSENSEETMKTATNGVLSGQKNLNAKYTKAVIKTNHGNIEVEFYGKDSPITVNNFLNLAQDGFYNNTRFHRVIQGFMIQGGDPNSRDKERQFHGQGGPGYRFADEFNQHKLVRGSLAMANAGPGTNGSQFFIVTAAATPWLDRAHTNFGKVIAGMDVVDKIERVKVDMNDNPSDEVVIKDIELK